MDRSASRDKSRSSWHPAGVAGSERLLAGIDVGGTKCAVVLGSDTGDIVAESRIEDWASGDPDRDLGALAEQVRAVARQTGTRLSEIAALGVSSPGPLDSSTGIVIDAPNLVGWRNVPLRRRLEAELGVPVRVENDANAAALAEWRLGAGQGARSLVFLTMSTGVGAGLIFDGRLYRGAHFEAGEVGHVPVALDGRACSCGLRGCLEAYVGGAALAERMRRDAERGGAKAILELAGGDPERISARVWVEAIRARDAYALELREDFLDHLAQGLSILIIALDPERIVLGTIVRENPELFLDEIRTRTRARIRPELHDTGIEPGALGARLPAYAALSVAALAGSE
jgi:glucokinase